MSLLRYHIRYPSLSTDEREKLIRRIEAVAYTGFFVCSDFCSGEFFLSSESELSLIDIPKGCCLTKL